MATTTKTQSLRTRHHQASALARVRATSKKEQILALFLAGAQNVGELASLTHTRPSYVASVLREASALPGYFDLYTTTEEPMNIYSKFFAKRLGFRTVGIARRSVRYINQFYQHFAQVGDRAGQHHALVMALTMFNRARWSNKVAEADAFRNWLVQKIMNNHIPPAQLERRAKLTSVHLAG